MGNIRQKNKKNAIKHHNTYFLNEEKISVDRILRIRTNQLINNNFVFDYINELYIKDGHSFDKETIVSIPQIMWNRLINLWN